MAKKFSNNKIIWPIQQYLLIPAFDNDQLNFFFSSKAQLRKNTF